MSIAGAPGAAARPAPWSPVLARLASVLADPRRALLAAVVVLSGAVCLDALSDPDAWWHLLLGQWTLSHHQVPMHEMLSYTVNGATVVPHEWLSSAWFAVLYGGGGLFLLALAMGAVSWSGLIAIVGRSRARGAGPVIVAVGTALAAKATEPVLGTRPQVFTFALTCWTLLIAERYLRRGGRTVLLLPPIFAVWANLHGGFVAGLGLLALMVAGEAAKRALHTYDVMSAARIARLALATGLSVLAACLNPVGPAIFRFALSQATGEGAKGIIEWQPPNFADPGMWALLALLLSFAALAVHAALRRRLDLRDALLGACACAVALLAVRNTALCVAVVAPVWIGLAADAVQRVRPLRERARRFRVTVTPATVAFGVIVVGTGVVAGGYTVQRLHASSTAASVAAVYPACAADVLARAPTAQRVFTAYATGGYVAYRLWPHATVYAYGESDAYTVTQFKTYYRIAGDARSAPSAMQLLDSSDTTAVLYPSGALTAELTHTTGWTHVTDDHGAALFVRGDASWAAGASC